MKNVYQPILILFASLMLSACSSLSFESGGSENAVNDTAEVNALLKQAIKAQESGNGEEASAAYAEMLDKGAKSSRALNHYAVFLRGEMEFKQAESIYLRALDYSPNDPATHYNIAILYELYQGEFAKAKKHFERYQSLQSEPDKKVKAWIRDLDRRIAARKKAQSEAG